MPTVHRAHGLRFLVYVDDHPPPHVHVAGRGTAAKVMLEPAVALVQASGLSKADVARALAVVTEHREAMIDAWKTIHD